MRSHGPCESIEGSIVTRLDTSLTHSQNSTVQPEARDVHQRPNIFSSPRMEISRERGNESSRESLSQDVTRRRVIRETTTTTRTTTTDDFRACACRFRKERETNRGREARARLEPRGELVPATDFQFFFFSFCTESTGKSARLLGREKSVSRVVRRWKSVTETSDGSIDICVYHSRSISVSSFQSLRFAQSRALWKAADRARRLNCISVISSPIRTRWIVCSEESHGRCQSPIWTIERVLKTSHDHRVCRSTRISVSFLVVRFGEPMESVSEEPTDSYLVHFQSPIQTRSRE